MILKGEDRYIVYSINELHIIKLRLSCNDLAFFFIFIMLKLRDEKVRIGRVL